MSIPHLNRILPLRYYFGSEFCIHNLFVVRFCFFILGLGMTLKSTLESSWFVRVVLILWLISSFFTIFLLGRIDWIVHDNLYDFGLQFSHDWATPYWILSRLIYVCLAIPSCFSAVLLGLDFWKKINSKRYVSQDVGKRAGDNVQALKENSMLVSCPSCKKTFSKPLVMLDFENGRPKLVNTCPYCNARLGEEHSRASSTKDLETQQPKA